MSQTPMGELRRLDVHQQIRIDAPRKRVWDVLTSDVVAWWPKSFYVSQAPSGIVLEERVGGRLYEDWGNGQGALWATLLGLERERFLQWTGHLDTNYGGPAQFISSFRLEDDDGATRLAFHDVCWGFLSEETTREIERGWAFLLGDCLKPFIEQGTHPERPQSVGG